MSQSYQYFSRMVQILNVKLGGFFSESKHILVLGGSGSGKTSALLLLCYLMKQNAETIIWRDDTSTEWTSLADFFPWRVFIPQDCEFGFKHPNVEYVYFDPWDLNTIFNEIKRGQAHVIEYDPFVFETEQFISFWSKFFYALYRWKGPDTRSRVAFFTDELNDLAAGAKRGFVPRQLQLASNIYLSMKKFRKEKIRLVASSHAFGDLHKPVREGFNYYFFKRMDRGSIPDKFKRYETVIERLAIGKAIIVDEERSFNSIDIEELVKPKRLSIKWSGIIKPSSKKKIDELLQWKTKTVLLAETLHTLSDVPYNQLAKLLGYSEQSGLNNLMKRCNVKALRPDVERFAADLKKLEAPKETLNET